MADPTTRAGEAENERLRERIAVMEREPSDDFALACAQGDRAAWKARYEAVEAALEQATKERDEAAGCDGNCFCVVCSRHEWGESSCQWRQKAEKAEAVLAQVQEEREALFVTLRSVMDYVCPCGDEFPSLEQFAEHRTMVHTTPEREEP